jgi:glycine cleavage system regulatory protein
LKRGTNFQKISDLIKQILHAIALYITLAEGGAVFSKAVAQLPSGSKELIQQKLVLLSIGSNKPTPKHLAMEVLDIFVLDDRLHLINENGNLFQSHQIASESNSKDQFLAHFTSTHFFEKAYLIELREKLDDYKREYGSYGRPRK